MNIQQRAIIGATVVAAFFYLQIPRLNSKNNLTNDELQGKINTAKQSFVEAETKILGSTPIPDDTPLIPHPDPEKCVCKGTGKIIQGDGHIRPCPYHGEKEPPPTTERTTKKRRRLFRRN
jgi:hypothetical protein